MDLISIILLAIGLSMDAMAVSISCGLVQPKDLLGKALRAGITFGVFQAGMTIIGWALGSSFSNYIAAFDHYIALILLSFIGFNMIRDGLKPNCESTSLDSWRLLFTLAIATSIDALVAGVSLSTLNIAIGTPALLIGLCTFSLSFIGVYTGSKLCRIPGLTNRVDIFGGIILIGLGMKIFIEHLFL